MKNYLSFLIRSIADQKQSLKIVMGLFVIGIFIGGLGHETLSTYIQAGFKSLVERFKDLHGFDLFIQIFLHNFMAAALATASGIAFGVFPLLSAFLNGLIIGTVLTNLSRYTEWSMIAAIAGILPHGIFEIPAFLLSLALGWTLGTWPYKKEKYAFIVSTFNACSSIFFKIIIPFLIMAAAIETIGIELLR